MSFKYRVATVFGGSGFLGRHFVQELARTGTIVRVASRRPSRSGWLRVMGTVGQITPIAVDVSRDDSVAAAVKGADFVVNLIGVLFESGNQSFRLCHAEGPARIARLAKAAGASRLIHVSALGADPSSPSLYARSKAEGEKAVLEAFPEATILRPSVVFGAEDEFFNRFATMAQFSPFLPLIGGGKTLMQPVYVNDVANAVMAALMDPATRGRTFELGGPRIYTFRELMELMLSVTRRRKRLVDLSWGTASRLAKILALLPNPPLTPDQVELLKRDNVVSPGAADLRALGIMPTAAELVLPSYLERFRIGGRFAGQRSSGGVTH
ncbi:complex I NDUFA9 subunit family protein [Arenibaculum pallidiluteum]|uniref:complex I NDUFA9 subunit family protein n=1 Tax=Arenibaculum pallidiluteum TaxID=2812559 RepID=UPI001A961E8F|nr:complex I NDUFA9 subunit family protein [Arenibaculum pallidiluteum]